MHGAGAQGPHAPPEVIDLSSDSDSDDDSDSERGSESGGSNSGNDESTDEVEFVREVHRRVVPRETTATATTTAAPALPLFATLGVPQFAIDTPLTALGFHGYVPFRYGVPQPSLPVLPEHDDSSGDDDSSDDDDDDDEIFMVAHGEAAAHRRARSSSHDNDGDDVVEVAATRALKNEKKDEEDEDDAEKGVVEILPKRVRTAAESGTRAAPAPSISPLPRAGVGVCARAALADERCAVCLTPLGDADTLVRAAACGHMFCWHCIDEWLSRYKKICPVCKGPLSKAALQRVRVVDNDPPPPETAPPTD